MRQCHREMSHGISGEWEEEGEFRQAGSGGGSDEGENRRVGEYNSIH